MILHSNQTHFHSAPFISQKDLEYDILEEIQKIHRIIKEHGYQGEFGVEMKFGQLITVSNTGY